MMLRSTLASLAALAVLASVSSARADDTATLDITATIAKECNFVSLPAPLTINGGTGSLVRGTKATGQFTYSCNYNNGPLRVDISSTNGALVPNAQAISNGGGNIPYGICVRGPLNGDNCESISNYAPITVGVTQYQTISVPGFGAPNALVTATASYGFELQNSTPVSIAGTWSDVVQITLVP